MLLAILQNPQEKAQLMVELAVTIDASMPFVKATYNLEGDGPSALTCYKTISSLNVAARQTHYPNLRSSCDLSKFPLEMHEWKANYCNMQSLVSSQVFPTTYVLPTVIDQYERASSSIQGSKILFTFKVK